MFRQSLMIKLRLRLLRVASNSWHGNIKESEQAYEITKTAPKTDPHNEQTREKFLETRCERGEMQIQARFVYCVNEYK